ncbi:MAG: PD-(D/E)XK nuclease family protein [Gammaproteobacteria bacterium]|nr:PD-(D/E)XK nuclease family protein [Gammaproteobacteria bacterium]
MTQRLLQQGAILGALAGGATVVTAGERLARAVQWAYAEAQQAEGRQAWERPHALSWNAFLADLWSAHDEGGNRGDTSPAAALRLLSAIQSEALWEAVVRASGAGSGLLQPRAAAQAAQEAWELCHAYRLDPARFAHSGNTDAEQFAAWATAFRERCRRERWLDSAQMPEQLAEWMRAGGLPLPPRVVFAGFHEWAPQQQQFLQSLRDAGCDALCLEAEAGEPDRLRRVSCADSEHELRTAARWAAALLEQNSAARIGIVVHDLAANSERVKRTLDDALCPSARLGQQPERPYNLSLGRPLADAPVINDGLLLLQILAGGQMDFNSASQVLRSPFLRAAESESSARLRLELHLREGSERISLKRLIALAGAREDLPELVTALNDALKWKPAQARRQLPSAWARGFADVLKTLGWPGERTRDSAEHQAVEAFRAILGELARLDVLAETRTLDEAVAQLARLVTQQTFQPATDDVPVQVLGILEAAGLRFDHLWIAGWSDDVWPASPRPNPLIPAQLQRQLGMPHAGAQRELEYATRLTAQLLAGAADIVVSSPARDADRELRPSPLFMELPEIALEQLSQVRGVSFAQYLQETAPVLEHLDDTRAPALAGHSVHGGTGILKSQAACPFQAFAWHRLGAEPMAVPEPGLNALQRGSLVHDVLYRLHAELSDLASLVGRSEAELERLEAACVDAALAQLRAQQPEVLSPAFMALERGRLLQLLRGWLQLERERAPFSVAEREWQREITIGPLQFNTRVDRLDRLADGSHAIIDYKTGDAKPSAWQGERPDEPQLPCYAVTAENEVSAVLFAILRPGEVEYRGYARADGVAPSVTAVSQLKRPPDDCPDWEALLAHWRQVLEHLAEAYAAGAAQVAPKKRNVTCRRCHLAALCRIDEFEALGDPEDD